MALPDFESWAMFAKVVEHRSFSGAAQALGVSKATISKAVSRLETRLGTTLFHRTSRKLTLTDNGRDLAERAAQILAMGEAAEEAARESATAPSGLVRVAAPMTFGLRYVAPAVADFLVAHPGISIDLSLSDARIDIVEAGFDIALRIADLPDSSLRARRLAPVTTHIVASPDYLDRNGRPAHPAELARHACIAYTNIANPSVWHFRRGTEEAAVRPAGPLRADSGDAMLPALRAGLGIARLPDFIVDDDLRRGTLESILPDWAGSGIALHLLTPPGTLRPARVELLIAFFAQRFRQLCLSANTASPMLTDS
ncbi:MULTISPECIES: LysR family transcriptional regulator [unclassified Sphingomonas]|uniref:LysR family transcriptional regulator n=1 Tax=unclassified Sphingomonas TaxID=196159 RepID=UPI00082B6DAA|nr:MULTISPECIES: LysR family transcriptional regulator [unclassified Sphingomonas]MCH4894836.1 LysR family transcriptional regulator [Sphingomonas sp. SFZ2018-12]